MQQVAVLTIPEEDIAFGTSVRAAIDSPGLAGLDPRFDAKWVSRLVELLRPDYPDLHISLSEDEEGAVAIVHRDGAPFP